MRSGRTGNVFRLVADDRCDSRFEIFGALDSLHELKWSADCLQLCRALQALKPAA
jgi:hypothetical protein